MPIILGKNLNKLFSCSSTLLLQRCAASTLHSQDDLLPSKTVHDVLKAGEKYGVHTKFFQTLPKQKIAIEFSSPNIAKVFHVGHYRSTMVGLVISNILEAAGHDLYRINYLGDWGMQFALLYVGCQAKSPNQFLQQHTKLIELYHAYVEACATAKADPAVLASAKEIFSRMENNEPHLIEFWDICRELSVTEFKRFYSRLGIDFDEYSGESLYRNRTQSIVERCEAIGNLRIDADGTTMDVGGNRWLGGLKSSHRGKVSLRRTDGTSLYITRDILAAVDRYERLRFDRMIYVTDIAQEYHFKTLFACLDTLGYEWARHEAGMLQHCAFGRVKNMKTRDGQIQMVDQIFDETTAGIKRDRMRHSTRKADVDEDYVSEVLALSGLACHDLNRTLRRDYSFAWDNVLATKGNSGLFIQYTHCRLCNLESNCGVAVNPAVNFDDVLASNTQMVLLLHRIDCFGDVIQKSYEQLEPCHIVHFLFKLCHDVSRALGSSKVKGSELEQAQSYLLCFHSARVVIGNGLRILGITPLDKM